MLELMIERWSEPSTGDSFRWSLWNDGRRVAMGGPHRSDGESEADGRAACSRRLGRQPERVTRL